MLMITLGGIVAGDGEANAVQFTINGLGSATTLNKLPLSILGDGTLGGNDGELWDVSTNKITPITEGDTYTLRISFDITASASNPTFIAIGLDIGTLAFPHIQIYEDSKTLRTGGLPQRYSFTVPIFDGSTFLNNGGRLFIYCNSGTADIENRDILITRTSSGAR